MAGNSLVRITKEYKEIRESKDGSGVSAELVGEDYTHWKGSISGPDGTPYAGGRFVVDIVIPPNYPFMPPKMRFDTKLWHPNVSSQNGAICLDILKNEWSPALTLRTALLSLQALLCCPNPDDPQDGQVAGQFKSNHKEFERTAKFWTEMYASAKGSAGGMMDTAVKKLAEMGFPEAKCREALEKSKGNEAAAVEYLMANC